MISIKKKVERTLGRLEQVANFSEFVKAFSVFGAEMVELAHVTGKTKFAYEIKRFSFHLLFLSFALEKKVIVSMILKMRDEELKWQLLGKCWSVLQ